MASVLDFTVDREADADGALTAFPFCAAGLAFAIRWLRKRLRLRAAWRDEKFIAWLREPWPAPPVTDWEAFERAMERTVAAMEDDATDKGPYGLWQIRSRR